ncbi:MAG: 16S rRNA processing protein RimM [Chloroflexota bacterium]
MAELKFVAIGKIRRPYGVRGEVKVQFLTDFPERFKDLKTVYIDEQPYTIERRRFTGDGILIKFAGIDTPEAAAFLRNRLIEVPVSETVPLPPDTYYFYQILGLEVVTGAGEVLGKVTDIIVTGANDVYVVRSAEGREVLLPAIEDVIKEVDLTAGRLVVELLPGLV